LATVNAISCESRHLEGGVSIAVDKDGYSVVVEEDLPYDREIPALGLSVMLNSGGQFSDFDGGIFYLTAQNLVPLSSGGSWHADSPIGAYRRFLSAAGLQIELGEGGGWLVGSEEQLRTMEVIVTAHSWKLDSPASEKVARSLFLMPEARYWYRASGWSLNRLDIGYLPVGPSDREFLVTFNFRTDSDIESGAIARVIFDERSPRGVKCIWMVRESGRLLPEFSIDVDGDGVSDFLFSSVRRNSPNFLLSGQDGSPLLQFIGSELVVAQEPKGQMVGLEQPWNSHSGNGPHIYGSGDDGEFVQLQQTGSLGEEGKERRSRGLIALVEALQNEGAMQTGMTVFMMPGMSSSGVPDDVRIVEPLKNLGWELWSRSRLEVTDEEADSAFQVTLLRHSPE
jgi:hypothetical protein